MMEAFLELDSITWVILAAAAFSAGLIDSMAGGGGLIQIPSLFGVFPSAHPATLLGTNKISSVFGTAFAAFKYSTVARISWNAVIPATLMAFPGAVLGAYLVSQLPVDTLRLALPIMLVIIAVYTFFRKDLGLVHSPRLQRGMERYMGAGLGFLIGFYDGLFGPGTGSFLMVGFVALFGFNFLTATAGAKVVNVMCNLASLVWFVPSGYVMFSVGFTMAAFNVLGSFVGSALAIRKGSAFIRKVLLCLMTVLIVKTGYDIYWPVFFGLVVSRGTI